MTNATWRDLWLNEGFTTYIERRVIEEVYGQSRGEMEAALGWKALRDELDLLGDADGILHVDLTDRDPDDGMTLVPYEKGALFVRYLEDTVGRERFDRFLRSYFDAFAFQSITTDDFLSYLRQQLLEDPEWSARVDQRVVDQWIYRPGLPVSSPRTPVGSVRACRPGVSGMASGATLRG